MQHARIHITGIVQGVGMRPFVYREAVAHGIGGWVLNAGDGVHIEAHGADGALDAFVHALRAHAPAASRIEAIEVAELDAATSQAGGAHGQPTFRIIASKDETAHTTLVSPDIATCPDCLRELFDPADRRYHYPFINCTNCGPRFTIIRGLPYDRAQTSMDAFPMCPECAAEYADPLDRRFHAQPDACFACGPHITWRGTGDAAAIAGTTRESSDAIIERCATLLASGGIVAIKGLGGFHLACDAGNEDAVAELRRRKHRSNKPLAVMVPALDDARELCTVNATEASLLSGSVRPIVLLRRKRSGRQLARSVAFELPELGVMLPYTPLQHLLLAACRARGTRALVMTSGNMSEEPIETDDARAFDRLVAGGMADALLGNDRPILSRYDDSVARIVHGEQQLVRRARGYAPRPIDLPTVSGSAPSILACGPEQKATCAITRESPDGTAVCFVSQHIGDLENAETFAAWHAARERLEALFDLHPKVLACDLHPGYLSSQWAHEAACVRQLPLVEVQHHHAHIAAVIAEAAACGEHDPAEPVVGIALDGTGAGIDGAIWGGEVLVASLAHFERLDHLDPWPLPGGKASIRDPRRNAFSLLKTYGLLDHPGARSLLSHMTEQERSITGTMIERGLNSPLTTSSGRLLDALSAILGVCTRATYEGEPAIALEAAANSAQGDVDESTVHPGNLSQRTLLLHVLEGLRNGVPTAQLARSAQVELTRSFAQAAERACENQGIGTVALSGGVFMNRLILSTALGALRDRGLTVLTPRELPFNDGCIAYGQAAVARARLAQKQSPSAL